ncbi:MAG: phosphoribosylamine--glycine ligase [Gammaproteobacteria bacterium]|jgi:phosphoribosylamine--glycine ligase
MKVLVIGGGGREHALAWKAAQSPLVSQVFVAPGNAGTYQEPGISNVAIDAENTAALLEFAQSESIELTIVGPEAPLVNGIVDQFQTSGLRIFGPSSAAAQLEGSKTFTKDFLQRHNIPTAEYQSFTEIQPAIEYVKNKGVPIVIKADGLAAGKGVILAHTEHEAIESIKDMLSGNSFGDAGHRVVIEEFLYGEEASFICMVDGEHALPLATSQDHKARDNGDQGPNTGGMGAYSPAPIVTAEVEDKIMQQVIWPTVRGMANEGAKYTGFLYAGLMVSNTGDIKVIEYNCRFGDPEAQPIMMRLQSDLVELCIASCDGNLVEKKIQWDSRSCLGVVLAANGYPDSYVKGDIIKGIPLADSASKVFHAGTKNDDMGNILSSGGRVLCVAALGDTLEQAQKKTYQIVNQIEWDGSYFRTDIGFKALKN